MKKGILIDVNNETVTEITIGDYTEINDKIGSRFFDVVRFNEDNDVYVDDEGLFNEDNKFFSIDENGYPLSGNGVILGIDPDTGESIDTTILIDDLKPLVKFYQRSDEKIIKHLTRIGFL